MWHTGRYVVHETGPAFRYFMGFLSGQSSAFQSKATHLANTPTPLPFFFSLFLSAGYRPPTSRVPFRRSNPLGNVSRLFSSLGWHPSPRTRLRPCSMRACGSRAGWLAGWALGLRERPDAGHAFHVSSPWTALGFFFSASQPPSHP